MTIKYPASHSDVTRAHAKIAALEGFLKRLLDAITDDQPVNLDRVWRVSQDILTEMQEDLR